MLLKQMFNQFSCFFLFLSPIFISSNSVLPGVGHFTYKSSCILAFFTFGLGLHFLWSPKAVTKGLPVFLPNVVLFWSSCLQFSLSLWMYAYKKSFCCLSAVWEKVKENIYARSITFAQKSLFTLLHFLIFENRPY